MGKRNVPPLNVEHYCICNECGAVEHGNLFCNTCRNNMNAALGCALPPWPHKAERPCGAEEVMQFMARL